MKLDWFHVELLWKKPYCTTFLLKAIAQYCIGIEIVFRFLLFFILMVACFGSKRATFDSVTFKTFCATPPEKNLVWLPRIEATPCENN